MVKYIDAEKLKAEIERLHNEYLLKDNCFYGVSDICEKIEDFITSLQQEQPSLPSNLEEAAIMHFKDVLERKTKTGLETPNMTSFKAGAEWMAGQMENIGVKESPTKTFPRVNEFETGSSYRH